jgi:hypothetical protein
MPKIFESGPKHVDKSKPINTSPKSSGKSPKHAK